MGRGENISHKILFNELIICLLITLLLSAFVIPFELSLGAIFL